MVELVQFPWSPFCLVQKRILEYGCIRHKIVNVPPSDRSLVWRLTRRRYYQVPIIKHGRVVVFETEEDSQVIAKYLEARFPIGLFPPEWDGVQRVLWRYLESEVEGCTFRLNDAYYTDFVPPSEQLNYLRYKERKFGRGCLTRWRQDQKQLLAELAERLLPFEQMLGHHPYLLDSRPRFVDFDLWGMLANFLYSGNYKFPAAHARLKTWYDRLSKATDSSREKLRS